MMNSRVLPRSSDPYAYDDVADRLSLFIRRIPNSTQYRATCQLFQYRDYVQWIRRFPDEPSTIRLDAGRDTECLRRDWDGRLLMRPSESGIILSAAHLLRSWVEETAPADDGEAALLER